MNQVQLSCQWQTTRSWFKKRLVDRWPVIISQKHHLHHSPHQIQLVVHQAEKYQVFENLLMPTLRYSGTQEIKCIKTVNCDKCEISVNISCPFISHDHRFHDQTVPFELSCRGFFRFVPPGRSICLGTAGVQSDLAATWADACDSLTFWVSPVGTSWVDLILEPFGLMVFLVKIVVWWNDCIKNHFDK